jgi:hypothetical protein
MARDGIDVTAARARIDAQMPLEEKRLFGHVEIDTAGEPSDTDRLSDAVADKLEDAALAIVPPPNVPRDRALGALVHSPARGPRGLSPVPFLRALASWGGLEMERAAELLAPVVAGPWYRQADAGVGEPSPAALAAPLVLWALTRGTLDEDYLASAAASLARLTHTGGIAVANAVAAALGLQRALLDGQPPTAGWAGACLQARKWGGAPPSDTLEVEFATLLFGAAGGLREAEAPAEAVAALRAIGALGEPR